MEGSFRIGDWVVEPLQNRLVRGETRVKLDPKVMQVLVYLASIRTRSRPKRRSSRPSGKGRSSPMKF